jgi:hypothetical protein
MSREQEGPSEQPLGSSESRDAQAPVNDLPLEGAPEQARKVKGGFWTTASYLIWRGGW